jgi:hypothetical protein
MEPDHTYYLPSWGAVIGSFADDPAVKRMLFDLWSRFGHEQAARFEGVSYMPGDRKARITVQRDGRMEIFDVPMNPHPER